MALTAPSFDSPATMCFVDVSSTDAGLRLFIQLTPAQVANWSDEDLTDKVNGLRDAMKGFLSPGNDIQTAVSWQLAGSAQVLNEVGTA